MEQIASYLSTILQNEASLASIIIRGYGVEVGIPKSENGVFLHNNPLLLSLIYLVYKTLAIPSRNYPGYESFSQLSISDISLQHGEENFGYITRNARELVEKIKSDNTHIGLIIRQTLNVIELCSKNGIPKGTFNYDAYSEILQRKKCDSLSDVIENMPPSYFVPIINLKTAQKSGISFDSLSSGQKQMIYTISTFIYHTFNILTVEGNDRLRYRNLCYILDEVEICFHPEYQREFLKKFIDTLIRTGVNIHACIHIIVATHSPFLLSDIPSGNVLKLENGDVSDMEETFGANIHNLLNNGFFLNYSIGEIAKEKIEHIFLLSNEHKTIQKGQHLKTLDYIINHIGDEYLRHKATEALYDIMEHDELRIQLKMIDKKRKAIKAKLNKRDDEKNIL